MVYDIHYKSSAMFINYSKTNSPEDEYYMKFSLWRLETFFIHNYCHL